MPEEKLLSIQEAAEILNVSTKTLRRWEGRGTLVPQRTYGNHRRYTSSQIEKFASNLKAKKHSKIQAIIEDAGAAATFVKVRDQVLPEAQARSSRVRIYFVSTVAALSLLLLGATVVSGTVFHKNPKASDEKFSRTGSNDVLGVATGKFKYFFRVNIPSSFGANVEFLKDVNIAGNLSVPQTITAGTVNASNLIYGVKAGPGISVSAGQTPTISNTGVLSVGGATGAVSLNAGSGISISGTTISSTVTDTDTQGDIFRNISVGSDTITASGSNDTLGLVAGSGITLSADTTNKNVTISSIGGGSVTANGTTNRVAKFTGASALGDSSINDLYSGVALTIDASGNLSTSGQITAATNETINGIDINAGAVSDVTTLNASGAITFSTFSTNGGLLYTNGSGLLTQLTSQGSSGDCLLSNGANSPPGFSTCPGGSGGYWNQSAGALFPFNSTVDLLVGGQSSQAAKFAILNVNSSRGNQIASLSGDLVLDKAGSVQTTNKQTLTLGGGGTGNVAVSGIGTGVVHATNDVLSTGAVQNSELANSQITVTGGTGLGVSGSPVALGGTVTLSNTGVTSNIAGSGISVSGATGAVTITNTGVLSITGTTGGSSALSGAVSINNALTSGGAITIDNASTTQKGIAQFNSTNFTDNGSGTINTVQNINTSASPTFAGLTLSNFTGNNAVLYGTSGTGSIASATTSSTGLCLVSGASAPSWVNCSNASSNFWQLTSNALSPSNSTYDLLVGADSSASALFRVTGAGSSVGTNSIVNVKANTAEALVVLNQLGAGEILTGSSAGLTRFIVDNQGDISLGGSSKNLTNYITAPNFQVSTAGVINAATSGTINGVSINSGAVSGVTTLNANSTITFSTFTSSGGVLYTNGSGVVQQVTAGNVGDCLFGGANPSFQACPGAAFAGYWTTSADGKGLTPINSTLDLLIGGQSTTSAKFAFIGDSLARGSQTASFSADLVLDKAGNIQTTNNQSLTIGGDKTGTITLSPNNGTGFLSFNGDSFNDITGDAIAVNGSNQLSVDLLSSSSSAGLNSSRSGLEFNTGTGSKNQLGLLQGCGNGQLLKWDAVNGEWACSNDIGGVSSAVIQIQEGNNTPITGIDTLRFTGNDFDISNSGSTGIISLDSSLARWNLSAGSAYLSNTTLDLLVGGNTSTSAKFAFLGDSLARGNQTASFSADLVLDKAASITTTNKQKLTLGGGNTGEIALGGFGAGVVHTNASGVLSSSAVTNSDLQFSTITVSNGSGIGVSGSPVALGGTVTISNTGVLSVTGASGGSAQTGALTLNNASGSLGTITIDNAVADGATKGIAAFNATNFTASSGVINTIQNINSTATPTFAGLTLSNFTANNSSLYATSGTGALASATTNTSGLCLVSGAGAPSWANCNQAGLQSFWNQTNGALYPYNSTVDLLIGGQSTASADFAVINVNGSGPVIATLSGNLIVQPKNGAGGFLGIGTNDPTVGLTVQGYANSNAALGSELIGVADDRTFDTNTGDWTGSPNWKVDVGNSDLAEKNAPGNTAITLSGGVFTPEAGATYQITFDYVTTASVSGSITPSLGGVSGTAVGADPLTGSTETQVITTLTTDPLSFVPTTDWYGTIDNVSVKKLTGSDALVRLLNTDGTVGVEFRSGGSGINNTFIGYNSGISNTGIVNTALGYFALKSNTSGSENTAVGNWALKNNTTGYFNTANGEGALSFNTVGFENTANGARALYYNTSGSDNSANGFAALASNRTGSYNTADGYLSLYSNTSGYANTANGVFSLFSNTTGSYNAALGSWALYSNTTGTENAAFGDSALTSNETGSNNTANGALALDSNWGGSNNVGLGYLAGDANEIGDSNTFLGAYADSSVSHLVNATAIGANAYVSQDNSLVLGSINGVNGATASAKVGIGTTAPLTTLDVVGNIYVNNGGSIDTRASGTLSIGDTNATTVNIGRSGQTIYLPGYVADGDLFYSNNGTLALLAIPTDFGQCLVGHSNGHAHFRACGDAASSAIYWNQASGALFPKNSTVDLLVGGQSTTAATFAILNNNLSRGSQVASLSGDLVLDKAGSLQTTNKQTLTLGGSNTGNIVIDSGSGSISLSDNTSITGTLGVSGLISANGGLTVANGQTLTANGIANIGDGGDTITLNGSSITLTGKNNCNALTTDGSGVVGCNTATLQTGTEWWTTSSDGKALTPINSTMDFLLGGQASSSAAFAVTGLAKANHQTVASVSGNLVLMPNNGFGGKLGIGVANPAARIDINALGGDKGIFIEGIDTGTALTLGFSTNISSGTGISLPVASISSGNGISMTGNVSGGLTSFTGAYIDVSPLRTRNQVGTSTETGNFLRLARNETVTASTANIALTGAVASISSTCVITNGNCLDNSNLLYLRQDFTKATGAVLNILNNGIGSAAAIVSNSGGQAAVIIDKMGTGGDILTASAGGITKFSVDLNGNLAIGGSQTSSSNYITAPNFSVTTGGVISAATDETINGIDINAGAITDVTNFSANGTITFSNATFTGKNSALYATETTGVLSAASTNTTGLCLVSGASSPSWSSCSAAAGTENFWRISSGAISPYNDTLDLLIGANATTSAKFAVTGLSLSRGNQVATLSGDLVLDKAGSLQTTNLQTLTLGGSNTGNIVIDSGSGSISLSDNTAITGTLGVSGLISANGGLTVANGQTLTANGTVSLGDGGDNFSVDSNAFDVTTAGAISGVTTLNASGVITFSNAAYTGNNAVLYGTSGTGVLAAASTNTQNLCLTSGASAPSWTSCSVAASNYWQVNGNALSPSISTYDVLFGGDSTTAAKFAFLNNSLSRGNQVASFSADLVLDKAGSLQTTNKQTLTLGGSNTGNVVIDSGSSSIALSDNTSITGTLGVSGLISANGGLTVPNGQTTTFGSFTGDNSVLYGTSGTGVLAATTTSSSGLCLVSGASAPTWTNCAGATGLASDWTLSGDGKALTQINNTLDLLSGGNSTVAAKFAFIGNSLARGSQTASFSADLVLDKAGNIQTTNLQTLTLGGSNTGNLVLDSGSGLISLLDNTSITGTLGVSGLISANGGLTVANGQTLTANGIANIGDGGDTITLNGSSITLTGKNNCNALTTDGSGVVGCNTATLQTGTEWWTTSSDGKALTPINSTLDLLIGGQSTQSANFAVINNNSGVPTATVAGNLIVMPNTARGQTGGLVGIGTTNPTALLDISDSPGVNNSKAINISMTNSEQEYTYGSYFSNSRNLGTISNNTQVYDFAHYSSIAPTVTLGDASFPNFPAYGSLGFRSDTDYSNVTLSDNSGNGNSANATGLDGELYGTPTINNSGSQPSSLYATGVNGYAGMSPVLTNVPANSNFQEYGGSFYAYSSISGDPNLNSTLYGIYSAAEGNLSTAGNTIHYGGNFAASGTADNNYGIFIDYTTDATNNYGLYIDQVDAGATNYSIYSNAAAQSYFAGNVGIGTTGPGTKLEVAGGADTTIEPLLTLTNPGGTNIGTGASIDFKGSDGYVRGRLAMEIAAEGAANLIFSSGIVSNERFRISGAAGSLGNVGLGTSSPTSELHVTHPLSFGANGAALAIFDQIENQDILTASKSGTTMFTINSNGNIQFTGGTSFTTTLTSATGNDVTLTIPDTGASDTFCLQTLANCSTGGGSTSWWNQSSGALYPLNSTVDLLIGGQATTAAEFAFLGLSNLNHQTTASFSGNLAVVQNNGFGGNATISGQLVLGANYNPIIQTTQNKTLTLGGSTTGNIALSPLNNAGGVTINKTNGPLASLDIKDLSSVASLGSEKITAANDRTFASDTGNWTTSGTPAWKINVASSGKAADNAPGTGALSLSNSALNSAPVAGHTYQVAFDVSATSTSSGHLDMSFGSTSNGILIGETGETQTYTIVIKAAGTGALTFTPDERWFGTLDNVSIKEVTTSSIALRLESSNGTGTPVEFRAGGHNSGNIYIGTDAGSSNTTGFYNTGVGNLALASNTTGANNAAFGTFALQSNTTGTLNAAFGVQSLWHNTTGSYNSGFGMNSLSANTTGSYNSAFGNGSLGGNTTGFQNTAAGYNALVNNSTGYRNAALGDTALYSNITGTDNTAVGSQSLYSNTASFNTAIGSYSLYSNTTGFSNTAVGENSLRFNLGGAYNTAVGDSALYSATAGFDTGVGAFALSADTGGLNTAVGYNALSTNITGTENIALGYNAMQNGASGSYNIGIGVVALQNILIFYLVKNT